MSGPTTAPPAKAPWPLTGPDAYYKVPEQALNTARFDLAPFEPAGSARKYVICSTQRSGSWLLCRQLINAGIGVPHEYFNRLHIDALCQLWGIDRADARAYIRSILHRRTTPNGVWGTKLQWDQHVNTRPHLDADILAGAQYIFLYRADRCAQAVSLHISMVTGLWGFDGTETTKYQGLRLGDMEHVAWCLRKIDHENDEWRGFMAERGIVPLVIRYEDLTANQGAFVREIGQLLGLQPTEFRVPPPEGRENALSPELEEVRRSLVLACRQASGSE